MPDLLTFEPLYADQTEDVILERWRAWANEGLEPGEDVDQWSDTRVGSMWWAMTTGGRREAARLYDLMGTEVVAAAFPQWSWGEYLDDHGELRELARLSATPAGGFVTAEAPEGTEFPAGTVFAVEPSSEDAEPIEFETLYDDGISVGSTDTTMEVRAREAGVRGNVAVGAVTVVVSPIDGVTSVTNEDPMVGGTDAETDEALRVRIVERFSGAAAANIAYYRRLALNYPGVGRATVIPVADGAGTISIILNTADGGPVSGDVVDGFQALVDPIAGQGAGEGQTGATITVSTADTLNVDVFGTVEVEPGYSLYGSSGEITLIDAITAVLSAYIASVPPGGEVVREQVKARILSLVGVHDISNDVTLNLAAANLAVPVGEIPVLGAVDLLEGVV